MKRRYTEIELVREIDKTLLEVSNAAKMADDIAEQSKSILNEANKKRYWMLEQMRVDEKRLRAKVNSLQTNKLVHLKDALAAIRTKPLPGFEQKEETVNL